MHARRLQRHGDVGPVGSSVDPFGLTFPEAVALHGYVETEDGCWVYSGRKTTHGYGVFGRDRYVHRESYSASIGPIPDGYFICHRCDNPPCFNPDHLFAGPPAVNVQDMKKKDRHSRGGQSGTAKLSEQQVIDIRRRFESGERASELALEFGMNGKYIYRVINGTLWAHI